MLATDDLDRLLKFLQDDGYRTLAPTERDGAITYAPITDSTDLPLGMVDEQSPGSFRLVASSGTPAYFDALPGQASWKDVAFPPREALWESRREDGRLSFVSVVRDVHMTALIGVRSCELAAISVQDKVFLRSGATDPRYEIRRDQMFLVAVECGRAAPTCFCTSMGTGPMIDPGRGADLVLTELPGKGFVARGDTDRGVALLNRLEPRSATVSELEAASTRVARTADSITRHLDTNGLKEGLAAAASSDAWKDLESRCLACGNCTLVCPTCFCSSAEDSSGLSGEHASRDRVWASCFTLDYSYMYGHTVRNAVGTRYRHWITHKLSTWVDQFGSFGCVGCGRCITWCPVGIDIVEEATRITKEPTHA